jgi:hypothetical protein
MKKFCFVDFVGGFSKFVPHWPDWLMSIND